jgi:small subunit ribosomal protein S14
MQQVEAAIRTSPPACYLLLVIDMAKTSKIVKQRRKPKYQTRAHNRCRRCGRPRAYYRKFGLCRICLREAAHNGYIPGMSKSSW